MSLDLSLSSGKPCQKLRREASMVQTSHLLFEKKRVHHLANFPFHHYRHLHQNSFRIFTWKMSKSWALPVPEVQGKRKSESESGSVVSDFLWLHGLYSPWSSPGQNTGVGSLSLPKVIFPTQGSNPGHLHCRQILGRKRKHKQKMIKNTGYPEAMGLEYDHIWNSNWGLIGIVGGEEGEPRGNIPG